MFAKLILLVVSVTPAYAGGDYEPAIVKSFLIHKSSYVLVLSPVRSDPIEAYVPPLRHCKEFKIFGRFKPPFMSKWRGVFFPSRESHKKALKIIENAYRAKLIVIFGYMGGGFKNIDPSDNCKVESNGLEFHEKNEHHDKDFIMSYWGSP